nr:MAG TPA: GENERAL CONTROL PROTEIN GCN4, NOR1 BINDING PROTEIN, ALPHA/BETA COILED.6A [Caudoviricetes sp.]
MAKPTLYTKQGTDKAIAKAIEPLATKEELARASAGGKIDLGEYAKRTDLAQLATRADLAGYATRQQVADLPSRADLAGYATKSDVAGVARTSDLTGLATKAELTGLATKADVAGVAHTSDLTGLATKAELTEALKRVGITVCSTEAEAQALPDGALYFLVSGAAPAPSPTPSPAPAAGPTLVASAAGQVVGQTVTIKVDGKAGDKIVIGLNEKAQGTPANLTVPQGWEQLVAPYWVGTMRAVVIAGPWAPTITLTMSQVAEIGWAAASIRGASTVKAGDVKKRQAPPTETTTCTAPALAGEGVVLGFAFERTSAVESSEQVTVSAGWEKLAFASQEGLNYQTVTLARRTGSQPADLVVTYPNPQGSNGIGVQVIAHA